ncbi:uncharacterized protein (TIGR02680 family) [Streptomyces sp. 846.5]|nr:TIGR02680 family protein [Streptomyces sp. 846.5]TDU05349.1 uncharacterized protein (TIGR02680 family) [Streptomyces sp. 846.5]
MTRFEPSRAGIVNLWDYRDEEFGFAGGWLVLRGPNGSGKTKALEVLFPFVLDGRIDPKRLNPFAAEDRTMKSNLLFRGQDNAVGYVWLELRHRDTGACVTVGIGMHAQRHRDTPVRWHFVSEGRVGEDFSLLTDDDRPMTRKQLAEEIGDSALFTSATDYRAAIDQRLFGLGRERYEQLLTLILTLRRPQLAKNLDPVKLSDTLTDGLRPVDDDLIAEAARSFDDMEAVSRTLEGLTAADEATGAFLAGYTTYLRTHARAAADALTRRREDSAARRSALTAAAGELAGAEDGHATAEARSERAEAALTGLRATVDQLRSSAAYQALEQLADLERLVRTCADAAAAATAEAGRRTAARSRSRAEVERAGTLLAELEAAVSRSAAELAEHAAAAGLPWTAADSAAEGLAARAGALAATRQEAVRAVRRAQEVHGRAEQARDLARLALDRAQAEAEAAEQAADAAAAAVERARADAADALRTWAGQHRALLPGEESDRLAEDLAEALEQLGSEAESPTMETRFDAAVLAAVRDLREQRARLTAERESAQRRRKEIVAERKRVAAEHDDAPPPHPGRSADRTGRAGAPLWQLVNFADSVTGDQAASLEAALEATGLLDAWLSPGDAPSGVPGDLSDGWLVPGEPVAKGAGSLADLLTAEPDASVPAERITALLHSIATGGKPFAAAAQITVEGRYAHGVTAGAHTKPHAEYIGATARARRRAERIAQCEVELAAVDARLDEVEHGQAALDDAEAAFAEARAALPRTGAIHTALREEQRGSGRLRTAGAAADRAQDEYDQSVAACTVTERALRRTAAEHALDPRQLAQVEAAVSRFDSAARQLTDRRREAERQRDAHADALERLETADAEEQEAVSHERAARLRHTEEAAKLEALQGAVGAEAREVVAQVEAAEAGVVAAQREEAAARAAANTALAAAATARERVAAAGAALEVAAAEERDTAHGLAPYAARELLDVLKCPPGLVWPSQPADWEGGELPPAVVAVHDAVLAATRELAPTEASLKTSATRLAKALEELQTQLGAAGQDYHPEWDTADGVIVVRIADEQGPLPVGAFAARISAARRDQQLLLSDSEQRILEDALLTRLSQQIHDRTVDARDLIGRMNKDMRQRRMSSGTTVGVQWRLADTLDEEQRAVCGLLDADAARLTPDALARMRSLFAAQIKTARARYRELPYRELLAQVLDYRRWRQFAFQLVRPDGSEETLTRSRHSRLSGGEQSVSLHLPLFAAAHAMLNSAQPHAPRLLALDEAFAGVDDTGRGELMSLAAQFDLDLFMTGYDLWATHPHVTAAAHYDLAHSPVDHTVSALLLVWDGARLLADDGGELAAVLGSPGTRRKQAV